MTAASTSTFGSVSRAYSIAASRSAQESTRLTPSDDPARAGLTNTGRPSRSPSVTQRRRSRPQHRALPDRQTLGGQQLLGELLVHPGGRGQHTGPDVGNPGQLEQPLDGAVLAVGAVQHREHHVHVQAAAPRSALARDKGRRAGVDGSADSTNAEPLRTSGS